MVVPRLIDDERKLLEAAGFRYDGEMQVFYHCRQRKVISRPAVEHHDTAWVQRCLAEAHSANWVFHFDHPPAPAEVRELEAYFERKCGERSWVAPL